MKLKVCGMKHNAFEVSKLGPDYQGFIFWPTSSRFTEEVFINANDPIKKVGVFVDQPLEEVVRRIDLHQLNLVQLHGDESVGYITSLKKEISEEIGIIKAFQLHGGFDFTFLEPYLDECDYFLFDSQGELPGGNGKTFNWEILEGYPYQKPFFLAGGIGLEQLPQIKEFMLSEVAKYCHCLDVNSSFETRPGEKDIEMLKEFQRKLETINSEINDHG